MVTVLYGKGTIERRILGSCPAKHKTINPMLSMTKTHLKPFAVKWLLIVRRKRPHASQSPSSLRTKGF
ncbi:hypothetical protein ALO46_102197 [Pseudomonas syringae pv. solidagae]|uniref:Uncharacterized protein n=1 Tax=Pseudomonas syringae pv. aceris TaxID=199198 RepID=A0A0P9HTD9_PSESX|nr:hypothetical protein ALO91_102535 [Pseudomonas syringae pv. aceris]KPY55329.1 hypothetical protein ALO46_102197 [Pseudomonas syringae pv. solidagae]RMT36139.1 hypothetical protein ALP49_102211 [Pseudomonas syringae pv. solidagae]